MPEDAKREIRIELSEEEAAIFDAKLRFEQRTESEFAKSVLLAASKIKKTPAPTGQTDSDRPASGSRSIPESSEDLFPEIMKEIEAQTDRSAAIIAGALVDESLKNLLKQLFKPLGTEGMGTYSRAWDWTGPLGTFGSRITMAFVANHIGPQTLSDLILIKDIRNFFAHSLLDSGLPSTFAHPQVSSLCCSLSPLPAVVIDRILSLGLTEPDNAGSDPRRKYLLLTLYLARIIYHLTNLSKDGRIPMTDMSQALKALLP